MGASGISWEGGKATGEGSHLKNTTHLLEEMWTSNREPSLKELQCAGGERGPSRRRDRRTPACFVRTKADLREERNGKKGKIIGEDPQTEGITIGGERVLVFARK